MAAFPKHGNDVAAGRSTEIEHPSPQRRVAGIGYVPAVISLDHGDGGVVRGRDQSDRRAAQNLPDDATVAQRVGGDARLDLVETGELKRAHKRARMLVAPPRLALRVH